MNFSQLTTGRKITFGFSLVFALLARVAGIADTALGGAGQRLAKYSESARETCLAATLGLPMQPLKLRVNEFFTSGPAESTAACEAAQKELVGELDRTTKWVVEPARAAEVAKARARSF